MGQVIQFSKPQTPPRTIEEWCRILHENCPEMPWEEIKRGAVVMHNFQVKIRK